MAIETKNAAVNFKREIRQYTLSVLVSNMLSASNHGGIKSVAAATAWSAPRAESSHHGHAHAEGESCGAGGMNLSEGYFIEQDFRGDIEGDACLTVDLTGQQECGAALWRENDRTVELLRSPLAPKGHGLKAAVGFESKETSKTSLKELVDKIGRSGKKVLSGALLGSECFSGDGKPKDGVHVLNVSDIIGIDPANAPADSNYSLIADKRTLECAGISSPVLRVVVGEDGASVLPEEAVAIILAHWINVADGAVAGAASSTGEVKKSSKKKARARKDGLTIVVPNSFGSAARNELHLAAQLLGTSARHIFSRGLAAVAGSLAPQRALQSVLKESLTGSADKGARCVLFVFVNEYDVDISLVSCERNASKPVRRSNGDEVNCTGFDRLVSLIHLGVQMDRPEVSWEDNTMVELVRSALHRASEYRKVPHNQTLLMYAYSHFTWRRIRFTQFCTSVRSAHWRRYVSFSAILAIRAPALLPGRRQGMWASLSRRSRL